MTVDLSKFREIEITTMSDSYIPGVKYSSDAHIRNEEVAGRSVLQIENYSLGNRYVCTITTGKPKSHTIEGVLNK